MREGARRCETVRDGARRREEEREGKRRTEQMREGAGAGYLLLVLARLVGGHRVALADHHHEGHQPVQPLHQRDVGELHAVRRHEEEAQVHLQQCHAHAHAHVQVHESAGCTSSFQCFFSVGLGLGCGFGCAPARSSASSRRRARCAAAWRAPSTGEGRCAGRSRPPPMQGKIGRLRGKGW